MSPGPTRGLVGPHGARPAGAYDHAIEVTSPEAGRRDAEVRFEELLRLYRELTSA
jgi:hypothetical protein